MVEDEFSNKSNLFRAVGVDWIRVGGTFRVWKCIEVNLLKNRKLAFSENLGRSTSTTTCPEGLEDVFIPESIFLKTPIWLDSEILFGEVEDCDMDVSRTR